MMFPKPTRFKKNRLGSVAKKKSLDGFTFDSGLEGDLYRLLRALETGGAIRDLRVKPNVRLTRAGILMIPDFRAFDVERGIEIYHEAKGFETEVWRLKRRLWTHYGPGPLWVYKGERRDRTYHLKLVEELIPRVLP